MSFCITGLRFKDTSTIVDLIEADAKIGTLGDALSQLHITDVCNVGCVVDYEGVDGQSSVASEESLDNCDQDSENSNLGEYDLYSKVEMHMKMSMSLYMLNRQGQDILKEFEGKKLKLSPDEQKRRQGQSKRNLCSDNDVYVVHSCLQSLVNFNRMTNDMYVELLNLLDEELFNECHELDTFYVKDDEYKLESMYYKQESWVNAIEWDTPQVFQFLAGEKLDTCECTHLLMYFRRYVSVLDEINACSDNTGLELLLNKICDKLYIAIKRLEVLLDTMLDESHTV